MKTLFDAGATGSVLARLADLEPDSPRQWGRMTPSQAVCHLADAFRAALGDHAHESVRTNPLVGAVLRFVALHTPFRWPKNIKTLPAWDQRAGGTRPTSFEADVADLRDLIERFTSTGGSGLAPHPLFGDLTPREWGLWGWRHLDHHLRQFGA